MDLIVYLQGLASTTLSTIFTIFEFLGGLPFFVMLFAILYLVYNKKFAYNYFLTYASGFVIGSLFLKNVIARARPYDVNSSLKANRDVYSGAMPSAKAILSAQNASFMFSQYRKKHTAFFGKFCLIVFLIIVCALVGVSQLYFANNYLLDIIVGAGIGLITSIFMLKLFSKRNINKKYVLIFGLPLLVILMLVFVLEWFTGNFKNAAVFEFVGIASSVIIGAYIDEKRIKFDETKNNMFLTSFKVLITIIVLAGYYYLCKLLPGIVIFSFLKYFVAGIIVTIILPLSFKKIQKYFYIFSTHVKEENVVMSEISTSPRKTKKLAKKFLSNLKMGDVVLLSGDLGAGKSELVRSILSHSGVKKEITSPTFTLVNEYVTPSNHYYHFDMYRIEDEQEVVNIDFNEIIDKKDAIKFIEWPEKVEKFLPQSYKKITIVKLGNKTRNIILEDYTNEIDINKVFNPKAGDVPNKNNNMVKPQPQQPQTNVGNVVSNTQQVNNNPKPTKK